MSMPLELIIYPKSTGRYGEAVYVDANGEWTYRESDCDRYAEARRLTDTELAAEWQQAKRHEAVWVITRDPRGFEAIRRVQTLQRFATLPHYDEPQP